MSAALVVDTSSWVSYFAGRGESRIDESLDNALVILPPIVAAELLSGKMSERQRGALEDLLRDLPLCATDLDHWFRVGLLRRRLAQRGITISTPDAHIAQCTLDADAELMTEDAIFRTIVRHTTLRVI